MRSLALLAHVLAGLVSACGYRGDLERPAPMWGREPGPEAEPQKEEPLTEQDPTEAPSERERSPT
jgi:hypothetical protein